MLTSENQSVLPTESAVHQHGRDARPDGASLPMGLSTNLQGRDGCAGSGEKICPADQHENPANSPGRGAPFGDTVAADESSEFQESASHCRNTEDLHEMSGVRKKQATADLSNFRQKRSVSEPPPMAPPMAPPQAQQAGRRPVLRTVVFFAGDF